MPCFLAAGATPVAAWAQGAAPVLARPQLTPNTQPQSAIATSTRAAIVLRKPKTRTALVMSLPASRLSSAVVAPAVATASVATPVAAPQLGAVAPAPDFGPASGSRSAAQKVPGSRRVEVLSLPAGRINMTRGVSVPSLAPAPALRTSPAAA
ncbi:MAG TPA: hypothetical protein VF627_06830, partial [Abditibacterium sp.]